MTRSAAEKCTPRERQVLAEKQDGLCGCGCGQSIARKTDGKWIFVPSAEDEHTIPNAIRKGKPDSIWLKACHAPKTKKDVKDIARAKRRAGETGQAARRKRRGYSLIRTSPNSLKAPPGYKHQWAKRKLETKRGSKSLSHTGECK